MRRMLALFLSLVKVQARVRYETWFFIFSLVTSCRHETRKRTKSFFVAEKEALLHIGRPGDS